MMITPQARRRITVAVRDLQDARLRDRLGAWAPQARADKISTEIPPDIAAIALQALIQAERGIESMLAQASLDEDREADLLNDLGYVQSIKEAMQSEDLVR